MKGSWRAIAIAAVALLGTWGCRNASTIDTKPVGQPLGADHDRGVSSVCASSYSADWRPVQGPDGQAPTKMARPARGSPYVDPAYRTCVVRVTDHAADGLKGFARNDYSRRQAFNADDTAMVVSAMDGSWHRYSADAQRYLGPLDGVGGDAEPQWHPTNPNRIYYFPGFGIGMQIRELDVSTGKSRVVADLAGRIKAIWPTANAVWTKSEGSPSRDARYWGLMVDDAEWKGLGLLTYDLESGQILATYDLASHGKSRPDHVSMSLSGEYMVASFDDGAYAFTRDFSRAVKVHPKSEHSDLALDGNGDDIYVSIDYQGRGGPVYMTNLRTGVRTDLFRTYLERTTTAIHFSGKAFRRPGWVLASTYAESGGRWEWLHGKVFALELREHPRIINLAHHHVSYNEYFTEPHASVNRDFTRIVFNSNWESGSKTDIDTYLIELPKGVIPPWQP